MSTISLTRRIEREIAERLPAAILGKAIEYHCRKGIRPDCDCPVCAVKKHSHALFSFDRSCPVTADIRHFGALTKVRNDLVKAKSLL